MLALALVPVKNAYNGVDLWCEEHGYASSGQGSPIRLCVVVARTELAPGSYPSTAGVNEAASERGWMIPSGYVSN